MKTKKYTFSPQNGKPGYCVCAQVFDENGNHLATIKSTKVAKDASETAKLFSKSPELSEALKSLPYLNCGMDSSNRHVIRIPLEKWESIIELLKELE